MADLHLIPNETHKSSESQKRHMAIISPMLHKKSYLTIHLLGKCC